MVKSKRILAIISICILTSCKDHHSWPDMYRISDPELVPESIVFSERMQLFYLTSIAKSKIIMLDPVTGKEEDVFLSGEYGYMPGVGIAVDDERGKIMAIGGLFRKNFSQSAFYQFDMDSRSLLNYMSVTDTTNSFMNDLVLDADGNAYLTDTQLSRIYFYDRNKNSLDILMASEELSYPNGITISDNNKILYVASFDKGVRTIDLENRLILNSRDTSGMSRGIDGLRFYNSALYAIQNGSRQNGYNFRKLVLDKEGKEILEIEVLAQGQEELGVPLGLCIHDDHAFVITHSNIEQLDQEVFEFNTPDSLPHTEIRVYPLR